MFNISRLLMTFTLMIAAFGIVLPLAPVAILSLVPPVRSFEITESERLPDGRLRMTARLDKRWCVFRALSFSYHGSNRSVWRVGFESSDQPPSADTNRPGGVQDVGPWIVDAPPSGDAERLILTVRHDCGLVDVVSRLAEVVLENP